MQAQSQEKRNIVEITSIGDLQDNANEVILELFDQYEAIALHTHIDITFK